MYGSEVGSVKNGVFVGGTAVSAMRMAKELHSLGDEIFIFSSSPRGEKTGFHVFKWGTIFNIKIPVRYPSLPYLILYFLSSLFGLIYYCRQNKIDIISSHSGYPLLCIVPYLVAKIMKIPFVHTQYCTVGEMRPKRIVGFLSHPVLVRFFLTLPLRVVTISCNVRRSLRRIGLPDSKIIVIPPVVPQWHGTAMSREKYRKFLGIDDKDFAILFVGNLKKNKGIDILVDAVVNMASIHRKLKLIITTELIHDSFEERRRYLFRRIKQCGIIDKVIWLGIINDMPELISAVDVTVIPFLNLEGISDYPLVMLESMSVGTPVIASDIGSIREIIKNGENGILVKAGDLRALTNAFRLLLTDAKLRRKLVWKSHALFHQRFKAKDTAKRFRELLLKLEHSAY